MKPALVAASLFAALLLLHGHARARVTAQTPEPSPQRPPVSLRSPSTWSPELQVAVVTGGVTLLIAVGGGLFTLLKYRQEREDKRRAEAKAEEEKRRADAEAERADKVQAGETGASRSLRRQLTDRIGYSVGSVVQLAKLELDGDCRIEWRWNDIKTVRDDVQIPYIPARHSLSPPGSEFTQYPKIIKKSFPRELHPRPVRPPSKQSCEYQIVIEGNLNSGETLSYEYEIAARKAFLMTSEDVERHAPAAFKKEFCGYNVSTPVEKLEIYVTFPEGYQVRPSVGACMADDLSETLLHRPEISRILAKNSLAKGDNWARVEIDEPLMGFSYFIYWEPPAGVVVDRLRQTPVT
jgi:hypothetical protein